MRSDYVTVQLTRRQAYEVADAARRELESLMEDEGREKMNRYDKILSAGIEAIFAEWRKAVQRERVRRNNNA